MNAMNRPLRPLPQNCLAQHQRVQKRPAQKRHGAAAILIFVMLAVFVILAAITIDYSYMQLLQTELRSATDAAAKAGAEALSRTQNSTTAKNEAVKYAAANKVGGQPFTLSAADVEIGRVTAASNGKGIFSTTGFPPNAVRVNAGSGGQCKPATRCSSAEFSASRRLPPANRLLRVNKRLKACLCIDRSGSMTAHYVG
ncbi:MAG: pilus assembly protein TadG-related protein [Pirellulales bacterium]